MQVFGVEVRPRLPDPIFFIFPPRAPGFFGHFAQGRVADVLAVLVAHLSHFLQIPGNGHPARPSPARAVFAEMKKNEVWARGRDPNPPKNAFKNEKRWGLGLRAGPQPQHQPLKVDRLHRPYRSCIGPMEAA